MGVGGVLIGRVAAPTILFPAGKSKQT